MSQTDDLKEQPEITLASNIALRLLIRIINLNYKRIGNKDAVMYLGSAIFIIIHFSVPKNVF